MEVRGSYFLAPGKQPPVLNRRLGGSRSESGHSRGQKGPCCCEESNSSFLVIQSSLITVLILLSTVPARNFCTVSSLPTHLHGMMLGGIGTVLVYLYIYIAAFELLSWNILHTYIHVTHQTNLNFRCFKAIVTTATVIKMFVLHHVITMHSIKINLKLHIQKHLLLRFVYRNYNSCQP